MKPRYRKKKPAQKTGFFCAKCNAPLTEVDFTLRILFDENICVNCGKMKNL